MAVWGNLKRSWSAAHDHPNPLETAFAEQFGLPKIEPPMTLAEAQELHSRESVEGICVEDGDE